MLKMKTAAVGVSFHPFLEGNVGTQTTMLLVRGFACLLVALFFSSLFLLILWVDLELPVLLIEENWHCGVNSCVKSIHVMYAYMCKREKK